MIEVITQIGDKKESRLEYSFEYQRRNAFLNVQSSYGTIVSVKETISDTEYLKDKINKIPDFKLIFDLGVRTFYKRFIGVSIPEMVISFKEFCKLFKCRKEYVYSEISYDPRQWGVKCAWKRTGKSTFGVVLPLNEMLLLDTGKRVSPKYKLFGTKKEALDFLYQN